jgi:hypothetical protein
LKKAIVIASALNGIAAQGREGLVRCSHNQCV